MLTRERQRYKELEEFMNSTIRDNQKALEKMLVSIRDQDLKRLLHIQSIVIEKLISESNRSKDDDYLIHNMMDMNINRVDKSVQTHNDIVHTPQYNNRVDHSGVHIDTSYKDICIDNIHIHNDNKHDRSQHEERKYDDSDNIIHSKSIDITNNKKGNKIESKQNMNLNRSMNMKKIDKNLESDFEKQDYNAKMKDVNVKRRRSLIDDSANIYDNTNYIDYIRGITAKNNKDVLNGMDINKKTMKKKKILSRLNKDSYDSKKISSTKYDNTLIDVHSPYKDSKKKRYKSYNSICRLTSVWPDQFNPSVLYNTPHILHHQHKYIHVYDN